ncbi:MCP four helix bundle domain-containing protein [Microcoleus sp. FACHB-45]|nr:MCP four helix bundle domain-containing protein [Microcoleus sp. FACHB-84]MBD2012250.1 MCP four helix bundle domain-containing protein [Microcoleus sp. FACHB-45]
MAARITVVEGSRNSMLRKMNLQTRLIGAFLIMGLLVFLVAWVGWNSTSNLSQHIDTIGKNNLQSIEALWKINEGQTQIESSERALINPALSQAERQEALNRIDKAWQQIQDGFKAYEVIPRISEEDALYKQMLKYWEPWKQEDQEFLRINQEFEKVGILDPLGLQLNLINQGKSNSPEMARAKTASNLLNKLSQQYKVIRLEYIKTGKANLAVIESNKKQADDAYKFARNDIRDTQFAVLLGMTVGPLTAISLGIALSIAIAKPLDKALKGIINMIVSSSTEIAATIEQQERIAVQQAASVNQTTTTMDELGASSRQSAMQAESALENASNVLNMAAEGSKVVHKTQQGMLSLTEKVGAIAEQVLHLSQQTNQIANITNLVSDLANQTNMLAINATVEAVRSGEQGKGFGVVAREIRRLADESKKSSAQINDLVNDIKNAINKTVMVTDEGKKTLDNSLKLTEGTADNFSNVANAINSVVVSSQQIYLNTKQQAIAIEQVVDAMNLLNKGATETASGITQSRIGTQTLNKAALNLTSLV